MEPFVFSTAPLVSPVPAAALHRKLEIGCGGIIRGQISENGSPASRKGNVPFPRYTRDSSRPSSNPSRNSPRAIIPPSVLAFYGVTLTRFLLHCRIRALCRSLVHESLSAYDISQEYTFLQLLMYTSRSLPWLCRIGLWIKVRLSLRRF